MSVLFYLRKDSTTLSVDSTDITNIIVATYRQYHY
jgi:hypothetical protein